MTYFAICMIEIPNIRLKNLTFGLTAILAIPCSTWRTYK